MQKIYSIASYVYHLAVVALLLGILVDSIETGITNKSLFVQSTIVLLCLLIMFLVYAMMPSGKEENEALEERENLEWDSALHSAKLAESRITEKFSPIILKEAKASFNDEEQDTMEKFIFQKKSEVRAKHIIKIFNQLFEEEKKESE